MCRIWIVGALALGLSLAASETRAAQPEAPSPGETTSPTEASVALARSRFEQGLLAYESGDYPRAVTHWRSAHELMDGVPSLAEARHVLAFDLGQAQVRAYDVDHDRTRLGHAKLLLEDYVAWVERPQHGMTADEREDRERANELLMRIAIEQQPLATPLATTPEIIPMPDSVPPPVPTTPPRGPTGTGLIVAGSASLAGAIAASAGAGALAVRGRRLEEAFAHAATLEDFEERDDIDARGRMNNRLFIGSTVAAVALGTAGVAMLATGAVRRKRSICASATLGPSMAGAQIRFSF